ncbi:MAG TPA: hypothetical protein VIH90_02205 [Candidatus Saccharimonadales bacterium]
MANKQPSQADLKRLQKSINDLDKSVSILQNQMRSPKKPKKAQKSTAWKKPVIALSVTLAAILLIFGNALYWTNKTVVDTNHFVSTVGPIITKPPVQSAVATYTTTALFNNYDVQGYIQNALPPRAAFLAPALTTQVRNYSQTAIKTILANQTFQKYWYQGLTRTHARIINIGKNHQGNGTITVSDIGSQVDKMLQGTKLSFLASKHLPAKYGTITIATAGWLPVFHRFLSHIDRNIFLIFLLFFIFSVVAIVLSKKKMFMVTKLGLVYAGAMLISIITVNGIRGTVLSGVNSTYKTAAETVYNSIAGTFINQTNNLFIVSLLIAIVSWVIYKFKLVDRAKPEIKKLNKKLKGYTQAAFNNER